MSHAENIRHALMLTLRSDAGITQVVKQRVFWGAAPQDAARPYVVLSRTSAVPSQHSRGAAGHASTAVQVDAYANNIKDVERLARAVRHCLDIKAPQTWGGLVIDDCVRVSGPHDLDERPDDKSDRLIRRVMQEYEIRHGESVPA